MNKCSLKIYKLLLVILILSLCVFFVACNIIDEIGNALSGATSSSSSEESSVESSTEESSEETENSEQSSTEEETGSEETPNYFVAKITSNATVNASPYIADAIVSDELSGVYYSANAPGGTPKNDGTGKIWLVLKPIKNYYIYDFKIEGEYTEIESLGRDLYCITDVKSNLTVKMSTRVLPSSTKEIFEDYGYGISNDGKMIVTWKENPQSPLRYVQLSYTDNNGSHLEYVDASLGRAELFSMTEEKAYKVSLRAVGYNGLGKSVSVEGCYMQAPKDVPFPRVEITTKDYIWPKCDFVQSPEGCWGAGITNALYEQCEMTLFNEKDEIVYSSSSLSKDVYAGARLKIRGNTSAQYAPKGKYPYKLKLDEKFDLLEPLIGRPNDNKSYADKDWLLLNYGSDGFRIAGDAIADAVGTEWSPDYCYVSLYVNGEYRGLYVLSEAVEEGSGTGETQWRVNAEADGFVFECDAYWWNEDLYFSTPLLQKSPMYFTFKYPDPDNMSELSEQYLYLKDYMIAFEDALQKDDDSYLDYIDLDSFVRWLLVADYLCIVDGGGCNLFLYKEDSTDQTKVKMGPNWDFDSYMGDYNALATIRMHWSGAPFYYQYLIKKDSFQQRYKELFAETYQKLSTNIDNDFAKINENSFMELLEHENARFGTEIVSLSSRKQAFTSWLDSHLAWMETQFLD